MAKSQWTKAEPKGLPLIEIVCLVLEEAAQKVVRNKGAAGVDGITFEDLPKFLEKHGEKIKQKLRNGTYIPAPVKRVDIPKPNGGTRMLGIPTLLDRTIQQAIVMTIGGDFEEQFSNKSYGFREGRNCQQAVLKAQEYVESGKCWVVEMDLSKFFDRVNHDILMDRVSRVITDKPLLKLIRRYLNAGIMEDGLVSPRTQGVPQGSPLSPLLSNVMLTELDWEIESRGLSHVRYADDCNIYVKSEKAAQRVLNSITQYVEGELKLRVNRDKSGTFRPKDSTFLGYTFSKADSKRIVVAEKSVKRLWTKLHKMFNSARGTSLKKTIERITPVLRGWRNYYRLDTRKKYWSEMDERIRHHLRKLIWIAWKRPKTRARNLIKLGLDPETAWKSSMNGRGAWWNSGQAHMNLTIKNRRFARLGLYSLRFMAIC
jgi:RNA-directed DNA polymerase